MGRIVVPQTLDHLAGIGFKGGILKKTFLIDGIERSFTYFVPKKLSEDASVIILAHGSYCNGDIMRTATAYAFEERSKKMKNTIIVYPDSFGPYWNDGRLGRMHLAREMQVDEKKFFAKIIDYTASVYRSSKESIYFGGFSNGGALGFKLYSSSLFKKMVLWNINLPSEENRDYKIEENRVPIMLINNMKDRMVPYVGGDLLGADNRSRGSFDSTYESILNLSSLRKLPSPSKRKNYNEYLVGENTLIEVFDGGHVIPHPDTIWPTTLGKGSELDSIKLVLDFFNL